MDERRSVRVRLKFHEPDEILTREQIEDGMAQSWYLVDFEDAHDMEYVELDIMCTFRLKHCPVGINLEADGFVLPWSQPARLMRDDDLIIVKRRTVSRAVTIPRNGRIYHGAWNDHFLNQSHRGDEVAEEAGGDESRRDEGEKERDGEELRTKPLTSLLRLTGGGIRAAPRRELRTLKERTSANCKGEKEKGGKKGKRAGSSVSDEQAGKLRKRKGVDLGQEVAVIPEKHTAIPVVTRCALSQVLDVVDEETESEKEREENSRKKKKSEDAVSDEQAGKLRKRKGVDLGQELALIPEKHTAIPVVTHCALSQGLDVVDEETESEKEREENSRKKKKSEDAVIDAQNNRENGKKRKKKRVNREAQSEALEKGENGLASDKVQFPLELVKGSQRKVKRQKLDDSGSNPVGVSVKSTETVNELQDRLVDLESSLNEGILTSGKKNGRKDINHNSTSENNGVLEHKSKKESAADKIAGKKIKQRVEFQLPAEKLRIPGNEADVESVPRSTAKGKLSSGSTQEETPKNEAGSPVQEQRPSRSARRKKAKRQWRREEAKLALHSRVENDVSERKDSAIPIPRGQPEGYSVLEEMAEVEAEEEMLPIVVRAGHIRFGPYDEDESPAQSRPSMPLFELGDQQKTKRQGQNWGQERSAVKSKAKRWATESNDIQSPEVPADETVNMRSDSQVGPPDFEKLPALDGAPQEGDVLAYRLIVLSVSWTPEISAYRVGVVANWDRASNMIKLEPHPDYPHLTKEAPGEDEGDLDSTEGMEEAGPYDENGVLEIEFSSLLEVQLMHRVHPENHGSIPGPRVEVRKESDPTKTSPSQADIPTREPVTETDNIPTRGQHGVEDGDRAEPACALEALVIEELDRKRMELLQRDKVDTKFSKETAAASEQPNTDTTSSRVRKYKFLKSAGVGSIVALLRSQQAL